VTANAAAHLVQHYVDNFRNLPWRTPPGEAPPDPYRVWLSEVMLQQTTVAAVVPRFASFLSRWPTVEALAAAREQDVLQEWAGLGYYARARNLIACARQVAMLGGFPKSAAELRKLPGIGRYTASAIAAIAFGEVAPAVDTNVARVIARLKAWPRPSPSEMTEAMVAMMPTKRPGDFVQAMMDLGATVCRPKAPRCGICPLSQDCEGRATGRPEDYPAAKVRRPRPERSGVAWWIERNGHIWLVRRPADGPLGGMAALPGSAWGDSADSECALGTIRHVFTHFTLNLAVVERDAPINEGWWQPIAMLEQAGLPTLYRRAAELVLSARQSARAAA
jgi:A/G-specific adenine glycosylase